MYRLWIGMNDGAQQGGLIYPTLEEALAHAYDLAVSFAVRIEVGRGEWHVFAQTGDTTLGPDFGSEFDDGAAGPPSIELELNIDKSSEPVDDLALNLIELDAQKNPLDEPQPTLNEPRLPGPPPFELPPPPLKEPRLGGPPPIELPPPLEEVPNSDVEQIHAELVRKPTKKSRHIGPTAAPALAKQGPAVTDRRRAKRLTSPLPPTDTQSVTWKRRPVRIIDVSWTGAKVATAPHEAPHAGEILAVEVRAFGLVAQLAGRVRWVRQGECGIAFDQALMTRTSEVLLKQLLGNRPS